MSVFQIIVIVLVSFFCGALLSFLVYFHMLNSRVSKEKKQASKVFEDIISQFGVDLNEKKDDIHIDFSDIGAEFDIVGSGSDSESVSEHKSE